MTEAQKILTVMSEKIPTRNIFKLMAARYVHSPELSDQFVREIREQIISHRDACIKAVTLEVVEMIEKYVSQP